MSTNSIPEIKANNLTVKEAIREAKKSIWAEANTLSAGCFVLVCGIVLFSIFAYVYMNLIPKKTVIIDDSAHIFSQEELTKLRSFANTLKEHNDINVVIATTRDNPYGIQNSDCEKYAADLYSKYCISTTMQDNSGICLYVDLTRDEPGQRYFYLYTYGTAFYSVSNEECDELFYSARPQLSSEEYANAMTKILLRLDDYDYHSTGLGFAYGISIVLPLIVALAVCYFVVRKRKTDIEPHSIDYRVNKNLIEKTEKVTDRKTRIISDSSSYGGGSGFSSGGHHSGGHHSGGGFHGGGGGGGFHGGGGGGGHHGGGGGRF